MERAFGPMATTALRPRERELGVVEDRDDVFRSFDKVGCLGE
jgi:hypothetical protein